MIFFLKPREFTRTTKSGEIEDPKFPFCNRLTHCVMIWFTISQVCIKYHANYVYHKVDNHRFPCLTQQPISYGLGVAHGPQRSFLKSAVLKAVFLHSKLKRWSILLVKLFWPTVRNHCFCDWEKLLKVEAEVWEFAKLLRSLEQFVQTVKGQIKFW